MQYREHALLQKHSDFQCLFSIASIVDASTVWDQSWCSEQVVDGSVPPKLSINQYEMNATSIPQNF